MNQRDPATTVRDESDDPLAFLSGQFEVLTQPTKKTPADTSETVTVDMVVGIRDPYGEVFDTVAAVAPPILCCAREDFLEYEFSADPATDRLLRLKAQLTTLWMHAGLLSAYQKHALRAERREEAETAFPDHLFEAARSPYLPFTLIGPLTAIAEDAGDPLVELADLRPTTDCEALENAVRAVVEPCLDAVVFGRKIRENSERLHRWRFTHACARLRAYCAEIIRKIHQRAPEESSVGAGACTLGAPNSLSWNADAENYRLVFQGDQINIRDRIGVRCLIEILGQSRTLLDGGEVYAASKGMAGQTPPAVSRELLEPSATQFNDPKTVKNLRTAWNRFLNAIAKSSPALWRYLSKHVKVGVTCRFTPPETEPTWLIGRRWKRATPHVAKMTRGM